MTHCPICSHRIDTAKSDHADDIRCPGCRNLLSLCTCCGVGFTVTQIQSEDSVVDENIIDEEDNCLIGSCPYCGKEINLSYDDCFLQNTMVHNSHRIVWDIDAVYLFCSELEAQYFNICPLCRGIILFRKFDAETIRGLTEESIQSIKKRFKLYLKKPDTTKFLKLVKDSNDLIEKRDVLIEDYGRDIYSNKGLNRLSRLNSEIAERVTLVEKSARLCGFRVLYEEGISEIILSKIR